MSAGSNRREMESFGQEDYGTYPEQKCSGFLYAQAAFGSLPLKRQMPRYVFRAAGSGERVPLSGCVSSVKVP